MGALTSRQHVSDENAETIAFSQYRYPPKSGNYFSSHFIMGGEKFESPQPETFLFGENNDLNFLSSRPALFPYPLSQSNEPTRAIHCLINIRKESLRFVPAPSVDEDDYKKNNSDINNGVGKKLSTFNIEFTFDCDADCFISIHYFCTEEITATSVILHSRDPSINSETYHYQKGANQVFCQMTHVFDPSKYPNDDLTYCSDNEVIPIAIQCATTKEYNGFKQYQTTIAVVEKRSDGVYDLKALKQKNFIDGLCYLLQEIYGIENKKNIDSKLSDDDDIEDNGSECVICMCELRDTLILPCRHLCLCNKCAASLRYQSNNCPICRAPFRALLNIKALKKCATSPASQINEDIPQGYECLPLMEALNGPVVQRSASRAVTHDRESLVDDNSLNQEQDFESIRAQAIYPSIDRLKRNAAHSKRTRTKPNYPRTSDSILTELSSEQMQFDNDMKVRTSDSQNNDNSVMEVTKDFVRRLSLHSSKSLDDAQGHPDDFKVVPISESQPVINRNDSIDNTLQKRMIQSMPDTSTNYFSTRSSTNSTSSTNQLLISGSKLDTSK